MPILKLKKQHKKNKFIKLIYIFILYITFIYTIYYSFKNNTEINTKYINYILDTGLSNINTKYKYPKIINNSIKYFLKLDIYNPETLFINNIIYKDEETEDINKLKAISSYITDPNQKEISNPLIYIYNTHQLENYNSENLDIYGITPNVLMASYILKEKLNQSGYETIVEETNITNFIESSNWDYSDSYNASRIFLLDKKSTYPTIKYFIDIHRDSVSYDESTIMINNDKYARILFVVGLEHSNYQDNLNVANSISEIANKLYPGLSKGIYKKSGPGVNGIYNQDINKNVILIELGGVKNTMTEVMNTINALTKILGEYIKNEK